MKKIHGILFFLIYTSTLLMPCVHFSYYFANQEYIQTVLCINKEKPKLNCNGKCYLAKKLQENYENSTNEDQPNSQIETIVFPIGFYEPESSLLTSSSNKPVTFFQESLHGIDYSNYDFRPS